MNKIFEKIKQIVKNIWLIETQGKTSPYLNKYDKVSVMSLPCKIMADDKEIVFIFRKGILADRWYKKYKTDKCVFENLLCLHKIAINKYMFRSVSQVGIGDITHIALKGSCTINRA